MADPKSLETLRRAARQAELRMRFGRALWALPTALTLGLGTAGITLVVRKVAPSLLPNSWAWAILVGAALSVALTVAWAGLRKLPPLAGALALDRFHRLDGRVSNALELASLAPERRTALMSLAIEDGCGVADRLSARHAVRIAFPPELLVSFAVGVGVAGLALLEVIAVRELPAAPATAKLDALEMSADDLELFKDALDQLQRDEQNPEVKAAIERFNQLVEDIEGRRLNRAEAFRRMQEIENDLLKGAEADKKALADALEATADELDKSELSRPVADALKKNDLTAAEKEMNKLADKMRGKDKPSKAELERLRQALDRAAQNKKKALEQLQERRAELKKQLLEQKNKKDDKPKSKKEEEEEKSLLNKKKRELERLNRDIDDKERALRRLSKLDRDLAKAAADLMRDLGLSAEDMQQAAEDLNRLQQEQMSDQQKEELRRRLQELRELIRQQGQGGEKMRQRLQRFMRRARGGQGQQGQGQQGQGQQGRGQRPGQGQQGQGRGKDGEGMGQGQGQEPGGVAIGPGGTPIEMPGGSGQGSGQQPGGDGSGQGGDEFGSGSGGDPKGDPSDLKADTHDVRAEAVDTGQGPSNAEVILSAARRGFTGKPYKNVYKQYKTVAEEKVETEEIPDGMRFYVRRYFQLIRPRE